jgi:NifU-like protein involved in Fe-S cluster formation
VMDDFHVSYKQENSICWDWLEVYLVFDNKAHPTKITERSRDGPAQMQTTAAASMLWEVIQGEKISTVLKRDYSTIKDMWLELSPRRRRSWVTALLATRNALHTWFEDGISEVFDDLL